MFDQYYNLGTGTPTYMALVVIAFVFAPTFFAVDDVNPVRISNLFSTLECVASKLAATKTKHWPAKIITPISAASSRYRRCLFSAHVACFVVQKEEFKPQIGSLSFVEITRRKFQRQQARLKAKKAEKMAARKRDQEGKGIKAE